MASGDGDGHPVTLTYRLTRTDVAAFEALPREFSGRAKLALFLPLFVVGGLGGWFAATIGVDLDTLNWFQEIGIVLVAVAIWFLCVTIVLTLARKYRVARFDIPDADIRLTADNEGLMLDEGKDMMRYRWPEIPWVNGGAAHVFMQTDARKVIIVPLRAFADAEAMHHFAAFADAASSAAS